MARKSKKKGSAEASGVFLPSHANLSAHVDAVLQGVSQLKKKYPANIPALKHYYAQARGLGTLVSPYLDPLPQVLEEVATEMALHAKAGTRYVPEGDLEALGRVMPGRTKYQFFKLVFRCWQKDEAKAKAFFDMLQAGYKAGVQYTTRQFKISAPTYVLPDARANTQAVRLLPMDHKSHRGFNHDEFARALVPIQRRDEYDQDPGAFRARFNNGEIVISENDLPSFLFSDEVEYDPEDPMSGFGTGEIFSRFLNHELIGSTGAYRNKSLGTKSSKAVVWSVEKITPRIVASVAVQAWVACSSMSQFGSEDGNVDLIVLHENIAEILEIDDTETQEILEDINARVPHLLHAPTGHRRQRHAAGTKPERVNLAEQIKQKRAAARGAKSEDAVKATPVNDSDEDGLNPLSDDDTQAPKPKKRAKSASKNSGARKSKEGSHGGDDEEDGDDEMDDDEEEEDKKESHRKRKSAGSDDDEDDKPRYKRQDSHADGDTEESAGRSKRKSKRDNDDSDAADDTSGPSKKKKRPSSKHEDGAGKKLDREKKPDKGKKVDKGKKPTGTQTSRS